MMWVTAVILLALIEFLVLGMLVGRARAKYAIAAPAVTGNEMFERYFRVHYNTLEHLIVFIPAIWFFGTYVSPLWASVLGVVYLIGRIVYAIGYIKAPEKRGAGMGLSMLPNVILVLGALIGSVRAMLVVS